MRPVKSTQSDSPSSPRQRDHGVEGVAGADEHRVPVGPTHLVAKLRQRPQGVVDAVLRAHDAQVAQQVRLAALDRLVGGHLAEPVDRGRAAHDEHLVRPLAASGQRDLAVALVGGDDDVGRPVGEPLEPAHRAVEEVLAAVESRQVQLGHQVVLVEDEPRAAPLEPSGPAGRTGPAGCRRAPRRPGRPGGPAGRCATAPMPYSRR